MIETKIIAHHVGRLMEHLFGKILCPDGQVTRQDRVCATHIPNVQVMNLDDSFDPEQGLFHLCRI